MKIEIRNKRELALFEKLAKCAESLGEKAYVIGGYVRDQLLNRTTSDIDIVSEGSGIQLAKGFADEFSPKPKISIFKTYGTAMISIDSMEIEFVGARKESYHPESRNPVVMEGSLEDDQKRRDFTINALAIDISKDNFGMLIDPFGGLEDIERKMIRTPCDPIQTFSDDPLRMMRAIRFASQLGFEIEPITFEAIGKMAERIEIITSERIHAELNKVLLSSKPSRGLELMEKCGLMQKILPELSKLKGVEYQNGYAHKDNFYHTLEVLDNVAMESDNLWLRWAALLHDVGKTPTKRFDKKTGWTFHGHEVVGTRMAYKIFKRLKLPLDKKLKYVQKLILLHLRPIALISDEITDSAVRRLLFDAGEDLEDLMILCNADITSKNESKKRRYRENYQRVKEKLIEVEEKDRIRNWEPPISGQMIMKHFGINPSKEVGIIKSAIREAILDGKLENTYDAAFAFMVDFGKRELGLIPSGITE